MLCNTRTTSPSPVSQTMLPTVRRADATIRAELRAQRCWGLGCAQYKAWLGACGVWLARGYLLWATFVLVRGLCARGNGRAARREGGNAWLGLCDEVRTAGRACGSLVMVGDGGGTGAGMCDFGVGREGGVWAQAMGFGVFGRGFVVQSIAKVCLSCVKLEHSMFVRDE